MAKHYKITARVHEEYGELGIKINMGRDYFEPAINGLAVAHDILEHPASPHPHGYVDEFMALGGIIAGRVESGWCNELGRIINLKDIQSDIMSLVRSSLYGDGEIMSVPKCPNYLNDGLDEIQAVVRRGIMEGLEEWSGGEYTQSKLNKMAKEYDVRSIAGWICKGHQLFRKRFAGLDTYAISNHLFERIEKICDDWLKEAEEYQEGVLKVDFRQYWAEIL